MLTGAWILLAVGAPSETLMNDPALRAYPLTAEGVAKVIKATRAMQQAAKIDAEFRKEYSAQQPVNATLDENVRMIEESRPRHCSIIRGSGVTIRDYVLTSLALLQADAVDRKEKDAEQFTHSVKPENLSFVRQHRREVTRAIREIVRLNSIKVRQQRALR